MDDAEDQDFHSQIYNNNVNASVVEAEQQQSINETSLFRGWQNSSRIFRVSRASGGKDRHSKVLTSKGLRDRRVRLSVSTAIQFYDLQDRLGYDQPSKAVDWLIKAAADSIAELPSLHGPFLDCADEKLGFVRDSSPPHQQKNLSASSTSETSKGSGLSLTRSDVRVNQRVKARERARERAKEKECTESEFNQAVKDGQRRLTTTAQPQTGDSANHVSISTSSTFTELLTGGNQSGSSPNNSTPMMMDYFTNAGLISAAPSLFIGQSQMGHNHHFSFDQHNLIRSGNDDHQYNLNFTISSSSNSPSGLAAAYNNRGTLQSNSSGSALLHHHNLHQRYNVAAASMEGSNNVPAFFMSMNNNTNQHHHFSTGVDGGLHLYYGNHKDKGKN